MKKLVLLICVLLMGLVFARSRSISDFSYERIPTSELPSTTEHIDKKTLEKAHELQIKHKGDEVLPDDKSNWGNLGDMNAPFYDQD